MTYSSNVHDKAFSTTGFGLQASTTFNVTKKWQVFGQLNYGKGIGSYLNDLSNLNVDIVPDPDNEGKMQVLPMLGWYAGLQYNICPNVFVSGTYSLSDFTLKTTIRVLTRKLIGKVSTLLQMPFGM